ncbi:MAG: cation transporter [Clostridia bacterium]|nr:cation transporter [Clostridia bacterium]
MELPKGNLTNEYVSKNISRFDIGEKTSFVGIVVNTILSVLKIVFGLMTGAISVVGDGINNFFDSASSVVTLIGFKISRKPADSDHPYGHGRFEYISAMIVAVFILFAGYELVKASVGKIFADDKTVVSNLSMIVLLVSIIAKLCLFRYYKGVAKKISSSALYAASKDSLYDVVTTSLVLSALALERVFGWRLDGAGGLLVSLFILKGGVGIIKETVDTLMGMAGSPQMRKDIENFISKNEKVLGIHDLLIHDYGPGNCFASVHVEFDRREESELCHDIIDRIERECFEFLNVHLVIHHDPVAIDDEEYKNMQEVLLKILKKYDESLSLHDLHIEKSENGAKLIFDVAIPDSLMKEKEKITEYIQKKLKKEIGEISLLITYDPV